MSKKSKLSRILDFLPSADDEGKFIDYCSYRWHSGILHRRKAEICIERKCYHYRKYRETLK